MKLRTGLVAVALVLFAVMGAEAQFKGQIERESAASGGIFAPQTSESGFFGWFDASKFSMHHSVNMSFMSLGGQGMSLGTYTNSMMYQFADNLNARADVSMSYSPSNSFGGFGSKGTKDFSGIYLSNAQVNYRPWENVTVQLQYRQVPYGYYMSPFSGPWYGDNGF
jgi:hypothetical protein